MNEGARTVAEVRPAGFWIRAVAMVIDFLVFAFVQWTMGRIAGRLYGADIADSFVFQVDLVIFTIVFTGAYTTFLHAVAGQTIGKMLVAVRVVGLDGELPGVGPALARYFAYFLSVATLGLGFLIAGLRRDKRALHDLVAGTRVERTRLVLAAVTAPVEVSAPTGPVSPPVV
jgi:uncharacterized RDD family membrane protein YckC